MFWRSLTVIKQAVNHLRRLHQVPCDKCAYFTGDYRLKCTVHPMIAMSESAIGCRDFLYEDNRSSPCHNCMAMNQCSNANQKSNNSVFKPKLTYLK